MKFDVLVNPLGHENLQIPSIFIIQGEKNE